MKMKVRYVVVGGARYLRVDDVATLIREIGSTEETDVRTRLYKAAYNLEKTR